MLVLSRKIKEGLKIGDDVTVQVIRIAGNRVTLGITAPRELRVVRTELPIHTPEADPHGQADADDDTADGSGTRAAA